MKSLVHFHFGSRVPRDGVPVAHIDTQPLSAQQGIVVVDTSFVVPQNAFFEKDIEIKLDADDLTHYVDKAGFWITDQANDDGLPMYFKHKLNFSIFGSDGAETADVLVVDEGGEQVSDSLWKYDCGANAIYHRLAPGDGVYFVVYPREDADGNLVERRHRELLRQAPAFTKAEAKDVLPNGCLNADSDSYIIDEQDGQPYYWRIRLPRGGTYFLRYTEDGLLKLKLSPTPQGDPWYLEVQNATVLTTQLRLEELLRYTVAEFDLQSFYPFPPIRLVTNQEAAVEGKGVISVGNRELVLSNKTPVDLKVYGTDGRLVRAMTTDQNKVGKPIQGIYWEVDTIESIDEYSGRVSVKTAPKPGERVLATYYHKENTHRYTGINLNPVYNDSIIGERVAVLCRPSPAPCNATLSHVVMTADEVILEASDTDISAWLEEGTKTLDDLKTDWLYIPGESLDNSNNYMMLGIATVANPQSPDAAEVVDTRRRGGGIPDDLIPMALKAMPGAHQNWDIKHWDGPPEPVQGAILVYLPTWISQVFDEAEIRARASKFVPAGARLVFRYY